MATLGTAYIQVVPSTDGIQSSISNALNGGSSIGENYGKSLGGGISSGLKTTGAVMAGAATAAVAAGTAIFNMASKTAQAGDEIDKQSQKLRISAEDYQKLAFAAERSGTSMSTMATAQKTLASSDFSGSLMDAIQYVAGIADEEERAAMATELFGKKAGQEMLPLLNSGAEGVQALYDQCVSLGGVMSNDAVASSAAFQDSITNFQTALSGATNNIVAGFMPSITDIINGLAGLVAGDEQATETLTRGVESIVEAFSTGLPKLMEVLTNLISSIAENAPQVITSLVSGIINNLPQLITAAFQIITQLISGIIGALPQLIAMTPQIIRAIVQGCIAAIGGIYSVGEQIVSGIWQGISNGFSWICSMLSGWVGSVISYIKGLFGIHSPSTVMRDQVGTMLARGIGEGFEDGMEDVNSMIEDAVKTDYDISTNLGINSAVAAKDLKTASAASSESEINAVLAGINKLIQAVEGKETSINLDGKMIANAVTRYQRQATRALGV